MVISKGFGRVLFLLQGAIIYKTHLHFKEHFRLAQLISFCTKLYQEVVQPIETENTTYTKKKKTNECIPAPQRGKQLNKNIIISTLQALSTSPSTSKNDHANSDYASTVSIPFKTLPSII